MATYFTADPHFGHVNIIGYTGRPYAGTAEMDAGLVQRWNAVVAPDDVVWVVGDFALGPIVTSLKRAEELNGAKILVAGNHDRCWAGHGSRSAGWVDRYLDAGFAEVRQGPVPTVISALPPSGGDPSDRDAGGGDASGGKASSGDASGRDETGQAVVVDHFPYAGDSHDEDRFAAWRPADEGGWLVHGHVHTKWRQSGRMVNVGVDAWGGAPVGETQLAELIAAGPAELSPLAWD